MIIWKFMLIVHPMKKNLKKINNTRIKIIKSNFIKINDNNFKKTLLISCYIINLVIL